MGDAGGAAPCLSPPPASLLPRNLPWTHTTGKAVQFESKQRNPSSARGGHPLPAGTSSDPSLPALIDAPHPSPALPHGSLCPGHPPEMLRALPVPHPPDGPALSLSHQHPQSRPSPSTGPPSGLWPPSQSPTPLHAKDARDLHVQPAWSADFPKPPSKSRDLSAYHPCRSPSPGSLQGTHGLGSGVSADHPAPPGWTGSLCVCVSL